MEDQDITEHGEIADVDGEEMEDEEDDEFENEEGQFELKKNKQNKVYNYLN